MNNLIKYFLLLAMFVATAAAQGLTLSSGAEFTMQGSELSLKGDLTINGTFNAGTGTLIFEQSDQQYINCTDGQTFNNITVIHPDDELVLNNNINLNGTLTITEGNFDLNSYTVTLDPAATLDETSIGICKNGQLTVTKSINNPSSLNVCGLGLELTSSADFGSTTITRGHTAQTGSGNTGIKRYYDVTPANNSGLNATIVFNYAGTELNSIPEAELVAFSSEDGGTNWDMLSGSVNVASNTVTCTGISSCSRFTLAGSSAPLPVELTSFTANVAGHRVNLNWQTATEVNNYGFEVERRPETGDRRPGSWEVLGFVKGSGNSSTEKSYSFTDNSAKAGVNLYRLKQIDIDGRHTYSDQVEVEVQNIPKDFILSQNYPNPFNPATTIKYGLPADGEVQLAVYNMLGQEVATLVNETKEAGLYEVIFDASRFSSGVYFYKLQVTNSDGTGAGNYVDIKKLTLLK